MMHKKLDPHDKLNHNHVDPFAVISMRYVNHIFTTLISLISESSKLMSLEKHTKSNAIIIIFQLRQIYNNRTLIH